MKYDIGDRIEFVGAYGDPTLAASWFGDSKIQPGDLGIVTGPVSDGDADHWAARVKFPHASPHAGMVRADEIRLVEPTFFTFWDRVDAFLADEKTLPDIETVASTAYEFRVNGTGQEEYRQVLFTDWEVVPQP